MYRHMYLYAYVYMYLRILCFKCLVGVAPSYLLYFGLQFTA